MKPCLTIPLLALSGPLPPWLDFLIMGLAIFFATFGSLLWFLLFRKKRRRRKHRHRNGGASRLNPTLAESGGLPPVREEKKPPDPMPPT